MFAVIYSLRYTVVYPITYCQSGTNKGGAGKTVELPQAMLLKKKENRCVHKSEDVCFYNKRKTVK